MAKAQKGATQKEKMEQRLGRLQLESMKLATNIQITQDRLNAVRKDQAEIAQKLINMESKTKG